MSVGLGRRTREVLALLLTSVLVGGALTSYVDEYERRALMPLRNLLVTGATENRSVNDGITITRYATGAAINPVHVANTVRLSVLAVLDEDERGGQPELPRETRAGVLRVASHFRQAAEFREYAGRRFAVWSYGFEWPTYGLPSGWVSGMAQGRGIEVALAGYLLEGDSAYLNLARQAAEALRVPIASGGAAVPVEGGLWFEEYAHPEVAPPRVLNGHIYALEALHHLVRIDPQFAGLYSAGLGAVREQIPKYDAGIWSRYDLAGTPANQKYHGIHVRQLQLLERRTGDDTFRRYAERFDLYRLLPASAFYRVIALPNRFLLLTLTLNILLVLGLLLAARSYLKHRGSGRRSVASVSGRVW